MLDMVPLIDFAASNDLPMLTRPLLPWQKRIYDLIGDRPLRVREMEQRAYFLEDVIVSNRHNAVSTYAASPHHREVFARILSRAREKGAKGNMGSKLLVSRNGYKGRTATNRDVLRVEMEKRGFQTIAPEMHSFDEQASIFYNADIIVTEFGAANANVVFCKPGTTIVEIIPEGQNDPWSAHLCASLDLTHVTLFHRVAEQDRKGIEIGGRTLKTIFFSYQIDVDLV